MNQDSCRATVRHGNSTRTWQRTIRTMFDSALFKQFGSFVCLHPLSCMSNVSRLSNLDYISVFSNVYLYPYRFTFLLVSNARTNKFYIFKQCTDIWYLFELQIEKHHNCRYRFAPRYIWLTNFITLVLWDFKINRDMGDQSVN